MSVKWTQGVEGSANSKSSLFLQSDLEEALGLTQAEQGLGLGSDDPLPDGLIQNIGNLIKFFEDTVGITALEAVLDEALGGNLTAVLDALGLTELEEALGLA